MARGLSTQPEHLRLPGQLGEAVNLIPKVNDGLVHRPPAVYIREIAGSASIPLAMHPIERSDNERYLVIIGDNFLNIVEVDNSHNLLTESSGITLSSESETYLDLNSAAADDFRFLSVADTTYVANRTVSITGTGSASYSVAATFNTYAEMVASTSLTVNDYVRVLDASGDPNVSSGEAYYQYRGTVTSDGTPAVLRGPNLGTDWDSPSDVYDDRDGKNCGGLTVVIARIDLSSKVTTDLTYNYTTGVLTANGGDTPFSLDASDWNSVRDSAGDADIYLEITQGTGLSPSSGSSVNDCENRPDKGGGYTARDGWFRFKRLTDSTVQLDDANDPVLTALVANVTNVRIGRVAQAFAGRVSTTGSRASMTAIADDMLSNTQHDGETTGFRDSDNRTQTNTGVTDEGISIAPNNFLLTYETESGNGFFQVVSPFVGSSVAFLWVAGPPYATVPSGYADKNVGYNDGITRNSSEAPVGVAPTNGPAPFQTDVAGDGTESLGTGTDADGGDPEQRFFQVSPPGSAGNQPSNAAMPQLLVRATAGPPSTWTVNPATWDPRVSGDDGTNPLPRAFSEGRGIEDMFLLRNRFGFIVGPYVTMSQDGDLFNFFAESFDLDNDSDPIDILPSSQAVNFLQRVSTQRSEVVVFSNPQQFEVGSGTALTQSLANVTPSTRTPFKNIEPAQLGSTLYFIGEDGGGSALYEYFFDEASVAAHTDEVSKHIEGALPTGFTRLVACPKTNQVFMLARGSTDIWVYSPWWAGSQKLQSAWCKWEFGGPIQDIAVIGSSLYLIVEHSSTRMLERIQLSGADIDSGWPYVTHGDHHLILTNGSYSGGTGRTSFDVSPYDAADMTGVVIGPGGGDNSYKLIDKDGASAGSTLEVVGNFAGGQEVLAAYVFPVRAKTTRPFVYKQGGEADIRHEVLTQFLLVRYDSAGPWRVSVDAKNGSFSDDFFFKADGDPTPEGPGTFEVPIQYNAEEIDVVLESISVQEVRWSGLQWTFDRGFAPSSDR